MSGNSDELVRFLNERHLQEKGTLLGRGTDFSAAEVLQDLCDTAINGGSSTSFNLGRIGELLGLSEEFVKAGTQNWPMCNGPLVGSLYDVIVHASYLTTARNEEARESYLRFVRESFKIPDIWEALNRLWHHYYVPTEYPPVSPFDMTRHYTEGVPKRSKRAFAEALRKAADHCKFIAQVAYSSPEERAKKVELELPRICRASMDGDTFFFSCLGMSLNWTPPAPLKVSIEELAAKPGPKNQREQKTNYAWCRRHWVSRGLWMMPRSLLTQNPIDLSDSSSKRLTAHSGDKLYRQSIPAFVELQDYGVLKSRGLPKEIVPEWAVLFADLQE